MDSERFDVTVIGAGPAGSRTAALSASAGHRVLLLEKRERIGHPVRCAEAVGPRAVVERYLTLDPELISSQVDGFLVAAPGGRRFEKHMPGIGFIVDREKFDRRLATLAADSGAEIRTGHQVTALTTDGGGQRVTGVRARDLSTGRDYEVHSSIVAGADGVEALSPRWAGIARAFRPSEIFSCAQELIEGIDVPRPHIEFHLGSRFAPGGYAWVFPKGETRANVGVGINPSRARGKRAVDYLDAFIAHRCPDGARTRLVVGGCEVARGLSSLAADGYLVVGEAARQNNPFSGGGIINALEAADMAADAISAALGSGDTSAGRLGAYSRAWKRSVGRTNDAFYHAARLFFGLDDGEIDRVIGRVARVPGVFDEKGIKPVRMILGLIAAEPALSLRLLKSFAGGLLGSLY